MALFQPTNISPSTLGGIGNGTIDVTKPVTISWQVNGNSPMVAYRIRIMKNDEGSTQMMDTGRQRIRRVRFIDGTAGLHDDAPVIVLVVHIVYRDT